MLTFTEPVLACAVKLHATFDFAEAPPIGGGAVVAGLEGGIGVCRVHRIGASHGRGYRSHRDRQSGQGRGQEPHMSLQKKRKTRVKRYKKMGLGGRADQSLPTPLSASLKRTCTSSATIEVSAHSLSPMRKASSLSVKLPTAMVTAPA